MTFIEQVYTELTKRTPINTDDFSRDWLGQSRSYYTSIKSRNMQASSQSLLHLMNKLTLLQQSMTSQQQQLLRTTGVAHGVLCERIAVELAQRSCSKLMADLPVRRMIFAAFNDLMEHSNGHLPLLIL